MHGKDMQPHEAAPAIVTGVAVDYAAGAETPFHQHERCQLLYAIEGVLRVDTPQGRWMVPPSRAVWLGPQLIHRLSMRGAVRVRSVLVDGKRARGLPQQHGVIPVSPLLRAVIAELAQLGLQAHATRRGRLLAALLREELRTPMDPAFHLPWPADPRIAKVCEAVVQEGREAAWWADQLAMSLKTFQRQFQRQTGLSFGQWRLRARLQASLQSLAAGQSILQVALGCGYGSQSAYTLAFRRQFGLAPTVFQARGREGREAIREPDWASEPGSH